MHGEWTRKELKREAAAELVQRRIRGLQGRRAALAKLRRIQTTVAAAFVAGKLRDSALKEAHRYRRLRFTSATPFQARGVV